VTNPAVSGAVLRTPAGTEEARFGCDGPASTVRAQAGLGWTGRVNPVEVVLADAELDGALPGDAAQVVAGRGAGHGPAVVLAGHGAAPGGQPVPAGPAVPGRGRDPPAVAAERELPGQPPVGGGTPRRPAGLRAGDRLPDRLVRADGRSVRLA
jgi:hypothetical protein